jgi:hypothetical protein
VKEIELLRFQGFVRQAAGGSWQFIDLKSPSENMKRRRSPETTNAVTKSGDDRIESVCLSSNSLSDSCRSEAGETHDQMPLDRALSEAEDEARVRQIEYDTVAPLTLRPKGVPDARALIPSLSTKAQDELQALLDALDWHQS